MEPTNGDPFLQEGLRAAMRWGDGAMARRLAERAGALRMLSAVLPLCELLAPPRSLRRRLWMHREPWCEARAEAVQALKQIGDPAALPTLVQALFDPDMRVRTNARSAVRAFGDAAVPHLLAALEGTSFRKGDRNPAARLNWSVDGMKALIDTLGALKPQEASPALVRVLGGQLPHAPQRWGDADALRAVCCTLVVLAAILLCFGAGLNLETLPTFLFTLLFCGLVGFLPLVSLFYMFLSLPIGALKEAKERDELALAAADALTEIRDKRALPGIVEVAFGWRRSVRWTAQWSLLHLLPLLEPEDAGLLSPGALHDLTAALGHVNSRLDLAIVRALEFVGTGQAVLPVQMLTKRGVTEELRREAVRVLPILQARQIQEQAASSLLRAAAMPDAPSEELLRAAHHQSQTPPEQLLRPGQSPATPD